VRSRNLKPEFFRDKLIAGLAPATRWVYQALWLVADDYGTAPLDADQLKGDLFLRWNDITVKQISSAFAELQRHGRIQVYRAPNGDLFGKIQSWSKHQRPNRPSRFRYPTEGEAVELEPTALVTTITAMELDPALARKIAPLPAGATRPTSKPFDKEVCDTLYEQWVKLIGAIDYGRFRKAIKPAAPDLTDGLEAIRLYSLHRNTLNERERGFANLEKFAQDIAHWLRLAPMPLQNEDGTLTEKGELVSGS
jgi:hypothetical protein